MYDVFEADTPEVQRLKANTHARFSDGLQYYTQGLWYEAICAWDGVLDAGRGAAADWSSDIANADAACGADFIDAAVETKLRFCRTYQKSGRPYAMWQGEDVWDTKE